MSTNSQDNQAPAKYTHRRTVEPPVDILESSDGVLVVADIPGASIETIDIRVENDTLTLEARRVVAEGSPPALAREYEEVDYVRAFRIPAGIDAGKITAESKNGTLLVKLPKATAAKTRKIDVRPS
jgi:HSP20 family molecular chaperone IbpA